MRGVTDQCGLCARPIREGEPWSHEPQGRVHMACWKTHNQIGSAQLAITDHASEPDDWNSWSPGTKRVSGCVLIGTSEPAPRLHSVCTIVFGLKDIAVKPHGLGAAVRLPYEDVACLDLGGPGAVTSGGGFFGGGFGVKGAAKGMLVAGVLNAITTRTSIQTVIRLATHASEFIFSYDQATPKEMRLDLSPVFMRISAAQRRATLVQQAEIVAHVSTVKQERAVPDDTVGQLQQLADLKAAGMLTDEEFALAKAKVLRFGSPAGAE